MQIQIHSKTLSLSEEQKNYIEEKVSKILHYSGRADDESSRSTVDVENEHTQDKKNHIHCKVNVVVPHGDFHAESYAQSVEASIDECEDKLRRQVKKYKEKLQH